MSKSQEKRGEKKVWSRYLGGHAGDHRSQDKEGIAGDKQGENMIF